MKRRIIGPLMDGCQLSTLRAQTARIGYLAPVPRSARANQKPPVTNKTKSTAITVRGARQNNLKGVDVDIPVGAFTVITGVAGAGKSSLAFDVLFAEGHRRYIETFSAYARQFLDRLDRPKVDSIEGMLPSIAIDRSAGVRTSRSTIGTMTSVADYLRALYARIATLHCPGCGREIGRQSAEGICDAIHAQLPAATESSAARPKEEQTVYLCFSSSTAGMKPEIVRDALRKSGFRRIWQDGHAVDIEKAAIADEKSAAATTVVSDRLLPEVHNRQRWIDSIEAALRWGKDEIVFHFAGGQSAHTRHLRCVPCGIDFAEAHPALFSFNNPVGACETCKGFGRTMDIDLNLVVPDPRLSIKEGAIKPFMAPSSSGCLTDLNRYLRRKKISATVPWKDLPQSSRSEIWSGEDTGPWYGIKGFFDYLEARSYKMHVRVLLSRYRQYAPCHACKGARLKPEAMQYRLGGLHLPAFEDLSLAQAFAHLKNHTRDKTDAATSMLLRELDGRLRFLLDVGLDYLTLSRQSRTLSGGEAQRVTLATALGSNLTNTQYVLDEPSMGLHARDADRLATVLRRLAREGNAVVVVEHNPALVRQADHIIDIGPGPGQEGGQIVFQGSVESLLALPADKSLTADHLSGRKSVLSHARARPLSAKRAIGVRGARENNLKHLDVNIPLGGLVCITGVSGSGKSTLADQVLYRNLRRAHGHAESDPGVCEKIVGAEHIDDVVLVDQEPLAGSSRVNAATYLDILKHLRRIFAKHAKAQGSDLEASAFSFNSKQGACHHCGGAGFEKIELQFLPDAWVKCPLCDGQRFRKESLAVRVHDLTIAQVLDQPAQKVAELFSNDKGLRSAVQPLLDMGLGYLSLGQPAPTLSGGESQRLKLAAQLAAAQKSANTLFILDEPTTGLHPADVNALMQCLQTLVDRGHSLVIVEHNLDVIASADWIIDMGPEGGDRGGIVVTQGPPGEIAKSDAPTGRALKEKLAYLAGQKTSPARDATVDGRLPPAQVFFQTCGQDIEIHGARQNNLKSVNLTLPRNKFIAITGVSGSGKSTLAFDVLYAEGQRRFLDCLSSYVRQFVRPLARPEVDRIEHVPPTVALQQKHSAGSSMATVGTGSELYHYLRLLFGWIGQPHCPACHIPGQIVKANRLPGHIDRQCAGKSFTVLAPVVQKRKGNHSALMKKLGNQGVQTLRVDGNYVPTATPPTLDRFAVHEIEAVIADIPAAGKKRMDSLQEAVTRALAVGSGDGLLVDLGGENLFFSTTHTCPRCGGGLPIPDPRLFTFSQSFGACNHCEGRGSDPRFGEENSTNEDDEGGNRDAPECPQCEGTRLGPHARSVTVQNKTMGDVVRMPIEDLDAWVRGLKDLPPELIETLLPQLRQRIAILKKLGLGYLTLHRGAHTLSTGEGQRIRIVAQLASNLRGACYVLDEPTVGLHPRDGHALVDALFALRDRGNTVVVVEHDDHVIKRADHLIDIGPGAGNRGGQIMAAGTPAQVAANKNSLTGQWLNKTVHDIPRPRRPLNANGQKHHDTLHLKGLSMHNLNNVNLALPLQRLVAVTGVSGSGKSTLVRRGVYRALKARLGQERTPGWLRGITGGDAITRVVQVDESPIGRTPRSIPATYVGVMDAIRKLFAETADARARAFKAKRFSFNVKGGRCERCEGQGRLRVTMALLPDVYIPCGACGGKRYGSETLAVLYNGQSIADVLAMSVDDACDFFSAVPSVHVALCFLSRIGLGYLQLGQASPTLSGGEAQRIKLAAELSRPGAGQSLYILDEPTTGLHMADVAKLTTVLHDLVERGDTVVVIEHNMDLVAAADCVIEMGPNGGVHGGQIVAQGPPEWLAQQDHAATGPFLREALQ